MTRMPFSRAGLILTLLLSLISSVLYSQKPPSAPGIVLLIPHTFTYDKAYQAEIDSITIQLKRWIARSQHNREDIMGMYEERTGRKMPELLQKTLEKRLEFLKDFKFEGVLSNGTENYFRKELESEFNTSFEPNDKEFLVMYCSNDKAKGTLKSLKKVAKKHPGMRYLINYPELHFIRSRNKRVATARIQLYDCQAKKILVDTMLRGEDIDAKGQYKCVEGSLECPLAQVMGFTSDKLIPVIWGTKVEFTGINHSDLKGYEREIERMLRTVPDYQIIQAFRTHGIDTAGLYFGFNNLEKGQFLAMMLREEPNKAPGTGLMQIKGTCYVGKKTAQGWEVQAKKVSHFAASTIREARFEHLRYLLEWGFFKGENGNINKGFWEGPFFH